MMQNFWIAASLMGVGAGILGWGLWIAYLGWASHHWPIVQGEILESGFRDYHEPSTNGCIVRVKYRYTARGAEHTSTRLRLGLGSYLSQEAAEALVARYSPGVVVTVYHHPRRLLAVLEPGYSSATGFVLMLGAFLTAVGLWMWAYPGAS